MIPQIKTLIDELNKKSSWGSKDLVTKLNLINQSITQQMKNEGSALVIDSSKKTKVDSIRKYDIIYVPLVGLPHYFLVHKVTDELVYGIILSSKNKSSHSIHEIVNDRFFAGSYGTNSYLALPLEDAKASFVRVFESKSEADQMFKKIKDYYKNVFKFKE